MFKSFIKDNDEILVFTARVFVTALTVGFAVVYAFEKFIG